MEERAASSKQGGTDPAFWDDRFAASELVFGHVPNAFVAEEAGRIPVPSEVVELGAGEGRNAVHLAKAGHQVTAVDFSPVALRKTRQRARREDTALETIQADVCDWNPPRQWDAVIVTFLQLLPDQRPVLYALVQRLLRPGGTLLAEWFRPQQVTDNYESGGPPTVDRTVTAGEVQLHFPERGLVSCEERIVKLEEGPLLHGEAAVVRVVFQQPA